MIKNTLLIALIFLNFYSFSQEEYTLKDGLDFYKKKIYTKCIHAFDYLIENSPNNHTYYLHRANAFVQTGSLHEALADLDRSIEIKENFNALVKRADVRLKTGNIEGANSDIAIAENYNAYHPKLNYLKGMISFKKGNKEDAAYFLNQVDLKGSSHYPIYMMLGDHYFESEELELAKEQYLKATEYNSNSVRAYKKLSQLAIVDSNYKQAIIDLTMALELERMNPELYVERAQLYFELNDLKSACMDLKYASENENTEATTLFEMNCNP